MSADQTAGSVGALALGVTILRARLRSSADFSREVGCGANPDAATLIDAGWRRWGPAFPRRLSGAFSFAVSSDIGAVWLTRDPLGEAPLYYAITAGGVVASPYVDELVGNPLVDSTIDVEAVALRMARCYSHLSTRTDYIGIAKVAPGTVVRIDESGTHTLTYWNADAVEPSEDLTFGEAAEIADHLISEAVADRVAAQGTASHLSGGLDSSLVTVLAARHAASLGGSLTALLNWSPRPSGPSQSLEYRLPRSVADDLGLPLLFARREDVHAQSALSDPLSEPGMAWTIEAGLAARAAALGTTSIVTGWGGDEGISHFSRLVPATLLRHRDFAQAWRAAASRRPSTGEYLKRVRRLGSSVPRPSPPQKDHVDAAWRRFSPDIADARLDEMAAWERARTTSATMSARLMGGHIAARNESWNRGGARLGISYYSPLQDRRVVDFALSLPPEFFSFAGQHRRLFRAVASTHVPQPVVAARKSIEREAARVGLTAEAAAAMIEPFRAAGVARGLPEELMDAWATQLARAGTQR